MNPCALARKCLTHWLTYHRGPGYMTAFKRQAGCFVSLHTPTGALRGCIGTITPQHEDLAQEIADNAISSGTRDSRFPPVTLDELQQLVIEVSVLAPPEPIDGPEQLDPRVYGVIVENGYRRGVLLPDLEGIDTVAEQLAIARRKALIGPDEPVKLWRFVVEKYHEHD